MKRAEKDPVERFSTKYEIAPNGCWIWTAARNGAAGYGVFGYGRRPNGKMGMMLAHRFSYTTFVGPIGEGFEIDHLCRNRACVNPEHLEAVTRRTNQRRGNSVSGLASRKTHCIRGHKFTPENTYEHRGARYCKACFTLRERERRERRRSAALS